MGLGGPFFIGALAVSTFAIAQSNDAFDEAFRAMKRNEKLQFELPPAPEIPTIEWAERSSVDGSFFVAILPILQIIFFAGLAVIVAFILFAIAKVIYETRFETTPKEVVEIAPPPLYTPDQEQARIVLDEIDALAAEGRYEEAVHELLFRSIQDIDIHRPNTIRRSLTSREIAELKILTPATREAFATIGEVVETSYFGGQKIDRSQFEICRAAYAQFAQKSAWQQAA